MRKSTQKTANRPASNYSYSTEVLNSIDASIGARVRFHRIRLGMSQEECSKLLKLTFQQLQKYEKGTNRISGSRIYQLSRILHVTPAELFSTVVVEGEDQTIDASGMPGDFILKRSTIELIRAFSMIEDRAKRQAVLRMVKAVAGDSDADAA